MKQSSTGTERPTPAIEAAATAPSFGGGGEDRPWDGATIAWIVAASVAGLVLRWYHFGGQILSGDEWHSINVALDRGFWEILSSFVAGSHSIPVALYYKVMMGSVGLSEITVYLPFLVAGSVMIPLLPWLVRRFFPPLTLVLFAWLLAVSPLLVFYSRFARPYGIVALFGFTAMVGFHLWWEDRSLAGAALYLLSAGLCAWFHLVALPFLAAPFLWAAVRVAGAGSGDRWILARRLLGMGLGFVGVLVLFLGAPALDGLGAIGGKSGRTSLEVGAAVRGLWVLLNGAGSPAVAALLAGVAALAGISLTAKNRSSRLLQLLIFASGMHFLVVALSRPLAINGPHILARYLIPALPVLLLTTAIGFERLTVILRLKPMVAAASGTALVGLIFLAGPLSATVLGSSNAAATHLVAAMIFGPDFERQIFEDMTVEIPQLYKELAKREPGALVVAEAPYHYDGYHLFFYQRVHGQRVVMGLLDGLCAEERVSERPILEGMRLRRFVRLDDPAALVTAGVDLVIFHKDLHSEIRYEPEHERLDTTPCIEAFTKVHGPPTYEDRFIVVFELGRDAPPTELSSVETLPLQLRTSSTFVLPGFVDVAM